ncbi:MAG: hypothetical protein IPM29_01180 [Planctomycetes bacterium]|nr:hypothetical protein [Planctomycetota bacterium]
MLSTEEFQAWGEHVVLFCHITSRVPDDPYQQLLSQKGGSGFPYLAFLDADGNVIAKPGGRSVEAFQTALDEDVAQWYALVSRAEQGDEDAKRDLFVRRVELQHFDDVEAARAMMAGLGLDEATTARLDQALTEQEFGAILGKLAGPEDAAEGGRLVAEMRAKGRIARGSTAFYYWFLLGTHAAETKNVELLEEVVETMESSDDRRTKQLAARFRPQLDELKKGG